MGLVLNYLGNLRPDIWLLWSKPQAKWTIHRRTFPVSFQTSPRDKSSSHLRNVAKTGIPSIISKFIYWLPINLILVDCSRPDFSFYRIHNMVEIITNNFPRNVLPFEDVPCFNISLWASFCCMDTKRGRSKHFVSDMHLSSPRSVVAQHVIIGGGWDCSPR